MNAHSVLKFGGSSVGTAESLHHVGDRIEEALQQGPTAAVASAARPPDTEGTTNRLLAIFNTALRRGHTVEQIDELMQMHYQLLTDLGLPTQALDERRARLENNVNDIKTQPSNARLSHGNASLRDQIQTWGEGTMYGTILHPYLEERGIPSVAVDSTSLIRTDRNFGDATVDEQTTYKQTAEVLDPYLIKGVVPIIPGFYGSSEHGYTVAFSRGGSDYTGALIAAGLQADHLDICTDRPGVMQVDPKRIPDTEYLKELSYWEMLVYAKRGASIVHKNAVDPIMGNGQPGIPMRVVDTATGHSETTVSDKATPGPKAIGIKDQQTFLSIRDSRMEDTGVLHSITKLLAEHELSIDVLSSETPTIEMTVDGEIPDNVRETLESRFHSVTIKNNSSIIVVVGHEVKKNRDAAMHLMLATIDDSHTRTEGPDSMSVVVPDALSDDILRKLYTAILQ